MGYASYSEDILKRHESDVHDIIRELEAEAMSVGTQNRVLPEFRSLVDQFASILRDPSHPVAMRLLEVRNRATTLEFELSQLQKKHEKLGRTNSDLNERNRTLVRDVEAGVLSLRTEKSRSNEIEREIVNLNNELAIASQKIAERDQRISHLEKMLMQAQVDVLYKK